MKPETDATIAMQCRIEKQNYAFRAGFIPNSFTSGKDLSFLLDSIDPCGRHNILKIGNEMIAFSTCNVIYK
jgi:hypothetical protein